MDSYKICRCFHLRSDDIADVLHEYGPFENSKQAMDKVMKITRCGTACGACLSRAQRLVDELLNESKNGTDLL